MNYDRFPCSGQYREAAMRMMLAGQAEGFIPSNRSPLVGSEELILARQATHDGYINAGVAVFYQPEDAHCLWLDVLYVAPEYRRQGIGRALVTLVRQNAIDAGLSEFSVGTMLDNAPMLSLLKSVGMTGGLVFFDERIGRAV